MRFKKSVSIVVLLIVMLSAVAAASGIFFKQGPGTFDFKSIHGVVISIYGKGVYANNSVSAALQAIPQDIVTLSLGIPLLLFSLYLTRKNSIKGRLLLSGTLGYFLITYCMYTFIAMYNRLFLIYVILISLSFFALALTLMSFDVDKLSRCFTKRLPIKFIGGYLLFCSTMIAFLWLSRVVPTLLNGTIPVEVEHGTTLPVQAFDLAIFLPLIFLSGLLLIKRKPLGYVLAPTAVITTVLIMAALLSKGISMALAGIPGTEPMIIMMSLFDILALFSTYFILKNISEPGKN